PGGASAAPSLLDGHPPAWRKLSRQLHSPEPCSLISPTMGLRISSCSFFCINNVGRESNRWGEIPLRKRAGGTFLGICPQALAPRGRAFEERGIPVTRSICIALFYERRFFVRGVLLHPRTALADFSNKGT
ncbi:MAG: hypothetical protein Q3X03_01145, partial [Eggerthellaceae bacterium]|nr:hypothetical protein [Eggerthellaceae bacterium]